MRVYVYNIYLGVQLHIHVYIHLCRYIYNIYSIYIYTVHIVQGLNCLIKFFAICFGIANGLGVSQDWSVPQKAITLMANITYNI